jgi:hypothetical protein
MPTRVCRGTGTGSAATACRLLGVVLMRLRVAEIHEHTVAHVFRYVSTEAPHSFRDVFLIGRNDLAQSGSICAESAVEPTRSQNITVTCRRSAVSWASVSTSEGLSVIGCFAPHTWSHQPDLLKFRSAKRELFAGQPPRPAVASMRPPIRWYKAAIPFYYWG